MPSLPPPKRWVIAVDGPAGAGKSSAARALARALGFRHIDTGAMYRAAAWALLQTKTPLHRPARVLQTLRKTSFDFSDGKTSVGGQDVAPALRTAAVTQAASAVATVPAVRRLLVQRQREMGRGGGVVMEGRDVGTVVFPRAPLKFFLDASPQERALRRWKELRRGGQRPALATIERAIRERDHRDRTRAVSPLKAAPDAIVIDSTGVSLAGVRRLLLREFEKRAGK